VQLGSSCDFALDANRLVRAPHAKPSLLQRIANNIGESAFKFGRARLSVFRLSTHDPLGRLHAVQVRSCTCARAKRARMRTFVCAHSFVPPAGVDPRSMVAAPAVVAVQVSKSAKGLHAEWHLRRVAVVPLLPPLHPSDAFYRSFGAAGAAAQDPAHSCPGPLPHPHRDRAHICPGPLPHPPVPATVPVTAAAAGPSAPPAANLLEAGWNAATVFECDAWLVGDDRRRLPIDPRTHSHWLVVEQLRAFCTGHGKARASESGESVAGMAAGRVAKLGLVGRLRRTLSPTRGSRSVEPALAKSPEPDGGAGPDGAVGTAAVGKVRQEKVVFRLAVLTEGRMEGVDIDVRRRRRRRRWMDGRPIDARRTEWDETTASLARIEPESTGREPRTHTRGQAHENPKTVGAGQDQLASAAD
jgi:hypothetical protein